LEELSLGQLSRVGRERHKASSTKVSVSVERGWGKNERNACMELKEVYGIERNLRKIRYGRMR
jgi:hypothetical protein